MLISRASEGAVSLDWIMAQPVFIRKKYSEQFRQELEERRKKLQQSQK